MPAVIPAILMLAAQGQSRAEQWVGRGRLAAAKDLVERLQSSQQFEPILIIAEDRGDEAQLVDLGASAYHPHQSRFHFGAVLRECLNENKLERYAYFGGSSAPLLSTAHLKELADRLNDVDQPVGIANNLYSTDWFISNTTVPVISLHERLPTDNPLGWVYQEEAGIRVIREPANAATRLDIDTPMDLVMLHGHRDLGTNLSTFLETVPQGMINRVQTLKKVLTTPAETLVMIGRVSSHLWSQLDRQTQIWVRVFAEERGMVASQRLARGEVRSLIGILMHQLGLQQFVRELITLAGGVIWDTRVWMAAELGWPDSQDRFAADLGWVDEIKNKDLRLLTQAINEAEIPILAGGHGVVSGGLYALLESIREQVSPSF